MPLVHEILSNTRIIVCNMEHREHNFECCMCNDAFPSEDQLTAHQVVKHGKPITEVDEWQERMKEAQEKRDKKRNQRQRRKEATSTPATFSCNQCVNFFSSQKDLDNHTYKLPLPSYARYANTSPRLCQNLTSTRTSCTTPHPENCQQYISKTRRWYVAGDTE